MPGIRIRSSRRTDSGTPADVGKESPSGSEPPPGSRRRPPRSRATESEQSDLGSDAASEVAGSPSDDHGADSDSGERRRNLLEDREFLGNLLDNLNLVELHPAATQSTLRSTTGSSRPRTNGRCVLSCPPSPTCTTPLCTWRTLEISRETSRVSTALAPAPLLRPLRACHAARHPACTDDL
eukprot:scaffold11257_cov133-Isochrysis_galbana.AAC.5